MEIKGIQSEHRKWFTEYPLFLFVYSKMATTNPLILAEKAIIEKSILTMIENPKFNLKKFCSDHNLQAEDPEWSLDEAILYLESKSITEIRWLDRKYCGLSLWSLKDRFEHDRSKGRQDEDAQPAGSFAHNNW